MAPRLRLRNVPALALGCASLSLSCSVPLLWSASAMAAPSETATVSSQSNTVAECVEAHSSGQELRQDGRLLESRTKFLQCSQEPCPELVRSECLSIIDELRSRIPSVVFRIAVDGEPRSNVAATMDGKELFSEIPTRAFEVDPGKHRFVFRYGELDPIEREVTITEGEKLVPIVASFTSPTTSTEQPIEPDVTPVASARRPIPLPVYVLSGVGALGLGGFIGFGLATRSKEGDLRSSCSPGCPQSEIDSLENRALLADVSLGIGIVALAAATTYYFLRPAESVEVGAMIAPHGGVQSQLRVTF